jgi:hypothetical protein
MLPVVDLITADIKIIQNLPHEASTIINTQIFLEYMGFCQ